MKTALVISGGGCKGAFAVGAIEWLMGLGLYFDIIVGTSTGALIAPLIGAGKLDVAKDIYSNVTTRQLIKSYCFLTLPWRSAIYCDKGLRKVIDRLYTEELHEALCHSKKDVLACTVSLNTGQTCYWSPRDGDRKQFCRALSASANQPGLMPPRQVKSGEDYHVDGGVREIAPIAKAIELGAERVFAIVLEQEEASMAPGDFNRIPQVLLRTLDLMFLETRKNDIALAQNDVELTVIRPKVELTGNSLEFEPVLMRDMMVQGHQRAKELVPQIAE